MRLWDWALAAYARDGAQESLLGLQDSNGQNVCYLLWAAWAAAEGRPLSADDLEAGADAARAWDSAAIQPLRATRRLLKKPIPDLDDGAREAVRARIKAVELEAERALLDQLEALAPDPSAAAAPAAKALVEAARVWERVIPRAELERLAAKLDGDASE
jgi:uncharacterized protein (TIGR02444 family)